MNHQREKRLSDDYRVAMGFSSAPGKLNQPTQNGVHGGHTNISTWWIAGEGSITFNREDSGNR